MITLSADLQIYNGEGDKSFSDWITKVEKIASLTHSLELKLTLSKAECIFYKLIEGMSQGIKWDSIKEGLCQGLCLVVTKMQGATRIRPRASNEALQEYIQRCMDLVIQATGTDPTTVTCQMTIVLII